MRDIIQDSVAYTLRYIPRDVIIKALQQSSVYENSMLTNTNSVITVERAIYNKIITKEIASDTQIYSGQLKQTVLLPEYVVQTVERPVDQYMRKVRDSIFRIPPEEREHRDIVSVISVKQRSIEGVDTPYNVTWRSSSLMDQAKNMLGAQSFNDAWVAPIPELIGHDMVKLNAAQFTHVNWVLDMEIAYPENFSGMNKSSIPFFREMVLHATRQFIYNQLAIKIDEAVMVQGAPIGAIREFIYKCEDAKEKYEEALTKFAGVETYNPERLAIISKLMI